jgi:hypothetical protein
VYDARALRVVVDDGGGARLADAVQVAYRLVTAVHKLWRPIHGEFDDYIANPKPSGYQALHTAVWGPGGAALEVRAVLWSVLCGVLRIGLLCACRRLESDPCPPAVNTHAHL